jgi:hypothetical protein
MASKQPKQPKQTKKEWTVEECELLVRKIRENPVLWNPDLGTYGKKTPRMLAMRRVNEAIPDRGMLLLK